VALDFDGFLVDSYELIRATFEQFGLDVGDSERFRNRRKFLKYVGGGKEFLRNLVRSTLPRKKQFRDALTERYLESGRVFGEFRGLVDEMIDDPRLHVGILSRNFARNPGTTIRAVLRSSGIDDSGLDFVIPIPVGANKRSVLEAMRSSSHRASILGADEIGDYEAAVGLGYDVVMGSYGFDKAERLIDRGGVPAEVIHATPADAARALRRHVEAALAP